MEPAAYTTFQLDTMALYQPIGDSFTIAKFAYDLYSKGFVVARHAPEDFRVLLKDMDAIKNVLGHIQSQLSDGEEFDERTKETLRLCYHSLQSFKPLLNRYEKLGMPSLTTQLFSYLLMYN